MTVYNDIVSARRSIYNQIKKVESGAFSLEKGIVLHKLNVDLMEGYRIQAKIFEISTKQSSEPMSLTEITEELR